MLKLDIDNVIVNKNKNQYEFIQKNDGKSKIKILVNCDGNFQFIIKLINFYYLEIETKNKKIIKNDNYNSLIFNTDVKKNDYILIHFQLYKDSKFILKSIYLNQNIEKCNIKYNHIFVINLKENIERRNKIQKDFQNFNIKNYEFLDAVNGKNIKDYDKIKNKIKTKGHYGCLLSHKKALELSKFRKYENVLIFEDDIELTDKFFNILNNTKVPKHNVIYFGGLTDEIKVFVDNYSYIKDYYVMGAYCYLVNEKMYDYILNLIEKEIDCIDILYVENLQKCNDILLLNDIITTNENTTDTSNKNKIFYTNLNKINIKYDICNKKINFNNEEIFEHYYLIGHDNGIIDYFIKEKISLNSLKQLKEIKNNHKIIITNFFDIDDNLIEKIVNYEYYILITDYYWINEKLLKNKNEKNLSWIFNYNNPNIIINKKIFNIFEKAQDILFLSNHSLNIYKNYFRNMNFTLLEIPKLKQIHCSFDKKNIKIGVIKTEYFYDEEKIKNIINKHYENYQTIYITEEYYMKNIKDFVIQNEINCIVYLPLYPICFNPNIEILNSLNIKIISF